MNEATADPRAPDSGMAFVRRATRLLLPTALNLSAIQVLTPALAAVMARTADPEAAIGGYAVALSIVLLINLPQLRVQQLTLVFLEDRASQRPLRHFVGGFAVLVAAITLLVALTPVGGWLLDEVFSVEPGVRGEAARGLVALIPFAPLALIRMHLYGSALRTGRAGIVWTGTVLGVASAIGIAVLLLASGIVEGALTAAGAMSAGAALEVAYLTVATRRPVREALPERSDQPVPTYGGMMRFFGPLLFSALLPAFTMPFLNASIARAAEPTVSLAAFAVAMGVFSLITVATHGIQSTALALFARGERPSWVVAYSLGVGVITLAPMWIVAFVPPVTDFVLGDLVGASERLRDLAALGLQLMAILPPFLVLEQCYASALMRTRRTRPIVYINLWRLGALFLFVGLALQFDGLTGAALGAGAIAVTLTFEALVTLAYSRDAYRELVEAHEAGGVVAESA
jgi:progressive ankylosis protein